MPNELIEKGLEEIKNGEINSAIIIFRKVVKLFPKHALGHFYLANLYSIKDEKDKAIDSFSEAWKCSNNLQEHFKNIPSQTLFILLSMDTPPKAVLGKWIERTKEFYEDYPLKEKLMIDFAKRILTS
jgi:tetratricopeptide (TPR) repeat protein